jgi:hypothetical protein
MIVERGGAAAPLPSRLRHGSLLISLPMTGLNDLGVERLKAFGLIFETIS